MNLVVYMLNLFVQLLTGVFMFSQFSKPKRSFVVILSTWYSLMISVYAVFTFLIPDTSVAFQFIIKTIISYLLMFFFYDDKPLYKVLFISLFPIIQLLSEPITYALVCASFNVSFEYSKALQNDQAFISSGRIMIANIILMLTVLTIILFRGKKLKIGRSMREILMIMGFDIVHLVFLVMYCRVNRDTLTEVNNLIQLAFQALLFAMLFIQYYNTLRTRKLLESEQELQILKTEMDNNYRYYKLADSKFDEISKLRHDIQNQFTTVRQLMSTPEGTEQARNIMDNIQEQLESVRAVGYCGNKTLNAVLTVKLNEERVRGIQTQVILRDCDSLDIDDYDLCSLVTNMFDNAVESCLRTAHPEQSFIEIKSGVQNDYFVLKITNSCEDEDIGKSRKGKGHGYGMKIAEETCRKYGGEFRLRKEGETAVSSAYLKHRPETEDRK